jgi:26S proteasome non-ATPase regulatory subunit 9
MTLNDQAMVLYQNLITRKDELEKEISALEQVLITHNSNMTDSLVDREGFPRADIDVYTVRNTRAKIIQLSNDHANLLKEIEKSLIEIHAHAKETGPGSFPAFEQDKPFALVDGVAPDSPASKAGLQRGDRLVKFGDLSTALKTVSQTFDLLPSFVKKRTGIETSVLVHRMLDGKETSVLLQLTPNVWAGKGVLGCHLVPC